MLSSFGHSPTITIPDFGGEVKFASNSLEDAVVRLVFEASYDRDRRYQQADREEIERNMHEEVLETHGFPEIIYECHRVSSIQKIVRENLCGVERGVTRRGNGDQPISARVR